MCLFRFTITATSRELERAQITDNSTVCELILHCVDTVFAILRYIYVSVFGIFQTHYYLRRRVCLLAKLWENV